MPTKLGTPVTWADLRGLLGLLSDDPRIAEVLKPVGKATWSKPSYGSSYLVMKKAGFDLMATPADGKKTRGALKISLIFLYPDGKDGHAQFAEPPYNLAFTSRKELRARMPKPAQKDDDQDVWNLDGVSVQAHYGDDGNVSTLRVALPG